MLNGWLTFKSKENDYTLLVFWYKYLDNIDISPPLDTISSRSL